MSLILCPLHLCILNVTERLSINLLRCNLSNIFRKDIKCTEVHEWCATFYKHLWVFVPTQALFLVVFIYFACNMLYGIVQKFAVDEICFPHFFKEVSYAHQGCIYLIKNSVKRVQL